MKNSEKKILQRDWKQIEHDHGITYQKANDGFLLAVRGFDLDTIEGIEKLKTRIMQMEVDVALNSLFDKIKKPISIGG